MTLKMEERFWITAQYLAKESELGYTVPCSAIIRDFIRAGTHNMVREKRTSEHDFEEADQNLSRLVQAMITETRNRPNPRMASAEPNLIREAAFVKAKTLCPLWPFC